MDSLVELAFRQLQLRFLQELIHALNCPHVYALGIKS